MTKPETMMIDDVKYVREDSINEVAHKIDGLEYCVIRTYSAGVHIGYVKEFATINPQQCTLINAVRLHYWDKAASLSQVAVCGVDAKNSRISVPVSKVMLTDVIEVISCSEKARLFFAEVKKWKM